MENGHFAFLSFLWGLRGNVWCSSYAHCKAHCRFPISVNWTFFRQLLQLRCYQGLSVQNQRFRSNGGRLTR